MGFMSVGCWRHFCRVVWIGVLCIVKESEEVVVGEMIMGGEGEVMGGGIGFRVCFEMEVV